MTSTDELTIDNSMTTTPPHRETTEPAAASSSTFVGFLWTIFGLLSALFGAFAAGVYTAERVSQSNDDYAGFLFFMTVPVGWAAGFVVALLTAWVADRNEPRAGSSRTFLVSILPMIPILLLVLLLLAA